MRTMTLRRTMQVLAVSATLAALLMPAFGGKKGQEPKPPALPAGMVQGPGNRLYPEPTDEQVVASMRKGVEFLLKAKTGDRWDTVGFKHDGVQELGGETALVLYALLHVGQGLDDPRLRYSSDELKGVVKYLGDLETDGTYAAALQASALALVPKRPETDKGLEKAWRFLMGAMGSDGGYSYGLGEKGGDLTGAWTRYSEARFAAKPDGKAIQDARKNLDEVAQSLRRRYYGLEIAVQDLAKELKEKAKTDRAAAARLSTELADLQKYVETVAVHFARQGDLGGELNKALGGLRDAEREMRTGAMKEEKTKGPDGKEIKKQVPKTKEDLAKQLEEAKTNVARAQKEFNNKFDPIGDLSNGQYGTLGAWALTDANWEIPLSYWRISDKFWRLMQTPAGNWPYSSQGGSGTDTMGVAGIASLYVTSDFLDTTVRLRPEKDKNIEAGLAWLNANFKADASNGYYLYGVERIGLASGLKFFNTTNWYKEAAKNLIKRQKPDGSWEGGFHQAQPNIATAYSLLFLARGRNPVVFNKLEYSGPWNARPRDNANITARMAKRFEKPINWQIVNLKVDAEEWLDAPILMITGSEDPHFTPADMAKLKTFVQAGGMIFSTADGPVPAFTEAMKRYMLELVDKRYEPRELPKDHFIFTMQPKPNRKFVRMIGLSNGSRELWIHSTEDMGASWQRRYYANDEHFEIPANMYLYATGWGSLRTKLQPLAVHVGPAKPTRTIALARVEYNGNWDPEPGAWPRAAKLAAADYSTDLQVVSTKIGELDARKTPIAHMTGTTAFPPTDADAAALTKFINDGGTLLVDATAGNAQFAESATKLLAKALPGTSLVPLPKNHPIYTGEMADGSKLAAPAATQPSSTQPASAPMADLEWWRKYAKLNKVAGEPRLMGIKQNGRYVVIFSAEDFTSGLLGTNTWGIIGYTPAAAELLVRNMVLFAAEGNAAKVAAAEGPGTQPAAGKRE